jgi:hypothetical protein
MCAVSREGPQQRSTPLCMSVTSALARRGPLPSTACSAPQARALIGVTISRWACLWLTQDGSVATVSILRLIGRCADSLNSTLAALRTRRAGVNAVKSRIVARRTSAGAPAGRHTLLELLNRRR